MFTVKAVGHGYDAYTVCLSAHAVDIKKRGDGSEGPSYDVILRDAGNEIVEVLDVSPDRNEPRSAISRDRPPEFLAVYVMNEHGKTIDTIRTWETRQEISAVSGGGGGGAASGRFAAVAIGG